MISEAIITQLRQALADLDLPVPDQKYTFGIVKAAQSRGDFEVLAERGRRALRVHLGKDVTAGLVELNAQMKAAST